MTINDAIYGLRNLYTGDEEETRIGDYAPRELPQEVHKQVVTLVCDSKFEEAYEIAVYAILKDCPEITIRQEIEHFIEDFTREDDEDEREETAADLRRGLWETWQDIQRRACSSS